HERLPAFEISPAIVAPGAIARVRLDESDDGYHITYVRWWTRVLRRKGQMNAKVDQRERSHETILDSASRLLREKGIAGASVSDVMKGAGLTVGGFYAH